MNARLSKLATKIVQKTFSSSCAIFCLKRVFVAERTLDFSKCQTDCRRLTELSGVSLCVRKTEILEVCKFWFLIQPNYKWNKTATRSGAWCECPDTSLGILGIVDIPLPSSQAYIGNKEFEKASFMSYTLGAWALGNWTLFWKMKNWEKAHQQIKALVLLVSKVCVWDRNEERSQFHSFWQFHKQKVHNAV